VRRYHVQVFRFIRRYLGDYDQAWWRNAYPWHPWQTRVLRQKKRWSSMNCKVRCVRQSKGYHPGCARWCSCITWTNSASPRSDNGSRCRPVRRNPTFTVRVRCCVPPLQPRGTRTLPLLYSADRARLGNPLARHENPRARGPLVVRIVESPLVRSEACQHNNSASLCYQGYCSKACARAEYPSL